MCYYIRVEDLAAGALIALIREDPACRKVSLSALDAYGIEVKKEVEKQSKEKAFLIRSREGLLGAVKECSDILDVEGFDTPSACVVLRGNYEPEYYIDELIDRFCGAISTKVLIALESERSVEALKKAA